MTTIAWLMIVLAVILLRGVSKGRVAELPNDIRDMFIAMVEGDTTALAEVWNREGTGMTAETIDVAAVGALGGTPTGDNAGNPSGANTGLSGGGSTGLLAEVRRLGDQAKHRYTWGGTTAAGGFDCSGIVWRALVNLYGAKRIGSRFTTYTFGAASKRWADRVSTPAVGDVVVWNRGISSGHMGIVIGPDRMFSALGKNYGIIESKMSSERGTPVYYRVKG